MRTHKMPFHQVEIQQNSSPTRNAAGEEVPNWVAFATRYAAISTLSGRELMAAQARNSETTHSIEFRYLAGLTQQMRIKFGTRIFVITGINDVDMRRTDHIVECKEGLIVG
jgi:SPP1 family predicted phage head-tail adaptor